jgi:hypothetical protein
MVAAPTLIREPGRNEMAGDRPYDGPDEFDLSAAMPSTVVVQGGGPVPVPRSRRAPYSDMSTTEVLLEWIAYGGAAPAMIAFELGRRVERGDFRDITARSHTAGEQGDGAAGSVSGVDVAGGSEGVAR